MKFVMMVLIVFLFGCTVRGKVVKVYDEERILGYDGTTVIELEDGTRILVEGKLGEVGETITLHR